MPRLKKKKCLVQVEIMHVVVQDVLVDSSKRPHKCYMTSKSKCDCWNISTE